MGNTVPSPSRIIRIIIIIFLHDTSTVPLLQHYWYHIFVCLTVIRPWLKLLTGDHGHVICMGNLKGVFAQENTPEGHTETHKCSFFFHINS